MNTCYGRLLVMLLVFSTFAVTAEAGVLLQSFGISPINPGPGHAFSSIGPLQAPGSGQGTGATVAWPVVIDFGALAALPTSIIVNFPDRTAVTLARVRSQHRGPNAFLWTGRGGDCSALFSAGANGWFKGVISCLNASYGIDTDVDGLELARYDHLGESPADDPSPAGISPVSVEDCPDLPPDPNPSIDILVLYNETVRAHFDPNGGHVNTDQFMRAAVDLTQLALDNSTEVTVPPRPVIATVDFAGTVEVMHSDSGDLTDDLDYVTHEAEPMQLRDAFAADVVMYITWNGGSTFLGLSNLAGFGVPPPGSCYAPYAEGALVASYAVNPGDYVFSHEFAHLFGANHDDTSVNNPWEVDPWAYGWWANDHETDQGERSLMAQDYRGEFGDCGQNGAPCTRILNYSNHMVSVGWFQTGHPNTAENSRVIDEFAEITSRYRQSLTRIFMDGFD